MIVRSLLAVVGALVITIGLLLAMDSVISVFTQDSGERFYRISDILPRPDPGRPDRPAPVARQPQTVAPELSGIDTTITVDAPMMPPAGTAAREFETDAGPATDDEDTEPTGSAAPGDEGTDQAGSAAPD